MGGVGMLFVLMAVALFSSSSSWYSVLKIVSSLPKMEFVIGVKKVSFLTSAMLVVCSLMAWMYCFHYFKGEGFMLLYLLVWFVTMMFLLVNSGGLVWSLVLWEYLGFVSFLLIAFYDNSASLRGSIMTLVSSRFGDVCLFLLVGGVLSGSSKFFFLGFMFWGVVASKSAVFPLVAWLLEAMRAPTPVSALVHSSTLVAAGAWFLLNYSSWYGGVGLNSMLLGSSLVTVCVTGVCALCFTDLKKMVALSTCKKISWCLMFFVVGGVDVALYQLVVHAVLKCLLFTLVGDLILLSGGGQESSQSFSLLLGYQGKIKLLGGVLGGLSGLPFVGVYQTKHYFLSSLFFGGAFKILCLVFIFVGMGLSAAYCLRLFLIVFKSGSFSVWGGGEGFNYSWVFFLLGSFFASLFCGSAEEASVLSVSSSLLVLVVLVLGFVFGALLNLYLQPSWFIFGCNSVVVVFEGLFYSIIRLMSVACLRWESAMIKFVGGVLQTSKWMGGGVVQLLFWGFIFMILFFLV